MFDPSQDSEGRNWAQKAAKASWQIFIVVVLLTMLSRTIPSAIVIVELVILLFLITGFVAAAFALLSIRKLGSDGVLFPGLVGVVLNGFLIFIFVTNFIAAREQTRARIQAEKASVGVTSSHAEKPSNAPTLLGAWRAQMPNGQMTWVFTPDGMTTMLSDGTKAPSAYDVDYAKNPVWLDVHDPNPNKQVMPLIVEFLSENSFRALGPTDGSKIRPLNFESRTEEILIFQRVK